MDFNDAFAATMRREGGYVLHTVPGDTGGQTYAGIARNKNPQWRGWAAVDRGETPQTFMVRDFYLADYWTPVGGSQLRYDIAASVYDFAVNAGVSVAVKLAQITARVAPDGEMGPVTAAALNLMSANSFQLGYFAAKVQRYHDIVRRNPSQLKFLLGWIARSLDGLK